MAYGDTTCNIAFKIYDTLESSAILWAEILEANLTSGLFNVMIGELHPMDLGFSVPYYIELTVEGERWLPEVQSQGWVTHSVQYMLIR